MQFIIINKILLNLGKIGGTDISGTIDYDKGFGSFVFKQNVFIDNLKHFHNRFSIKGKNEEASKSAFISGDLNLASFKIKFSEISSDVELKKEEIEFIQKNFDLILLDNGFVSLFNFIKLRELLNLVLERKNLS